jgi:alcohol dehydrogenase (cytochrome c)
MTAAFLAVLLAAAAGGPVTYERLRAPEREPENWLMYSGSYDGHRHSPLREIDRGNARDLKPVWAYQVRESSRIEMSPLAVDGILYITETPALLTALDGRTGRPLWTYRRAPANGVPGCCGPVNRGLAVLGDTLYHMTYDARLVALDRHSGTLLWETAVADPKLGYSSTSAPLVLSDRVIVGVAGGEFGIRGFLDAYDAKTGRRLWRLWTVPAAGEPGVETWGGESWRYGGAPTWVTGTYDPELDLIYWGTGNPSPDWNGDVRPGDNLYSNCLLAVDAKTGTLRWHFQFTPHDVHDWDSNQIPVLVDAVVGGRPRKLVVQANKNAFYYVLDRETGAFLSATDYTPQDWAKGIDERGRPVLLPGREPSAEGTLVSPGLAGGTNWFTPSFSPSTGLFYLRARKGYADIFYKLNADDHEPGQRFDGGAARSPEGVEYPGLVLALEATTGRVRWQLETLTSCNCGVLSTAGGLVFGGGSDGYVFALDDLTGKPLWRFQTGAGVVANPMTYAAAGKQYVVVTSGNVVYAFAR